MSSSPSPDSPPPANPPAEATGEGMRGNTVAGQYVVIAMIAFGLSIAVAVTIFWNAQTKPFRALTVALGQEFPKSNPRVEGGLPKKGPAKLRVVIRTFFDPNAESATYEEFKNRVLSTCAAKQDLAPFEQLELHALYFPPQKELVTRSCTIPVEEIRAQFADRLYQPEK
ncbi:MAG: hypothetical protein C0478_07095 [Planctomyces sp.]|nr:hypothetical protein [Planctomyces sp.]